MVWQWVGNGSGVELVKKNGCGLGGFSQAEKKCGGNINIKGFAL